MKWALAALLVCSVQLAHAGRHQVLVLRAEGNADSGSRTSVDSHVMRLAKNIDGKVEAGDITLTEAAAVVGCKLSDASCKDEVISTLGVDEIVGTTVTTSPAGLTGTVRRYTKGNAPRSAQTTLPAGNPSETKINAELGPLFGVGAATAKKPAGKTDKKTAAVTDKTPRNEPAATATAPAPTPPAPAPEPTPPPATSATTTTPPPTTTADVSTDPISSETTAPPPTTTPPPEGDAGTRRLPKIGMAIGGGLIVVGVIMWVQAVSLQGEIDNAPVRNPADFARLRELEGQADTTATFGNLFMAAGIIVGGLSTYWFIKDRRANNNSARTARITPTVFPHGAGVAIGGGW